MAGGAPALQSKREICLEKRDATEENLSRRCRWLRPGNLPSLLCSALLLPDSLLVCKRRNVHRHRCACNLPARFHGTNRSRYTGRRRKISRGRFPGFYLLDLPFFVIIRMKTSVRRDDNFRI